MRRDLRREQILGVAETLFAQEGWARTSVSKVAATAGIGRGTLYLYFDGKEGLLQAVLERTLGRLEEALRPFHELGMPRPRTREQLEALIAQRLLWLFRLARRNRHLLDLWIKGASLQSRSMRGLARRAYGVLTRVMRAEVERGQLDGLVIEGDPDYLVDFVLGGILLVALRRLDRGAEESDVDDLAWSTARLVGRVVWRPSSNSAVHPADGGTPDPRPSVPPIDKRGEAN